MITQKAILAKHFSNPHGWFLEPRIDIMRMAARNIEEMCGGSLEIDSKKDV